MSVEDMLRLMKRFQELKTTPSDTNIRLHIRQLLDADPFVVAEGLVAISNNVCEWGRQQKSLDRRVVTQSNATYKEYLETLQHSIALVASPLQKLSVRILQSEALVILAQVPSLSILANDPTRLPLIVASILVPIKTCVNDHRSVCSALQALLKLLAIEDGTTPPLVVTSLVEDAAFVPTMTGLLGTKGNNVELLRLAAHLISRVLLLAYQQGPGLLPAQPLFILHQASSMKARMQRGEDPKATVAPPPPPDQVAMQDKARRADDGQVYPICRDTRLAASLDHLYRSHADTLVQNYAATALQVLTSTSECRQSLSKAAEGNGQSWLASARVVDSISSSHHAPLTAGAAPADLLGPLTILANFCAGDPGQAAQVDSVALSELQGLLKRPGVSPTVRRKAAEGLACLAGNQQLPLQHRLELVLGLVATNTYQALSVSALGDPDPEVQRHCAEAIASAWMIPGLSEQQRAELVDAGMLACVCGLGGSGNPAVVRACMRGLHSALVAEGAGDVDDVAHQPGSVAARVLEDRAFLQNMWQVKMKMGEQVTAGSKSRSASELDESPSASPKRHHQSAVRQHHHVTRGTNRSSPGKKRPVGDPAGAGVEAATKWDVPSSEAVPSAPMSHGYESGDMLAINDILFRVMAPMGSGYLPEVGDRQQCRQQ